LADSRFTACARRETDPATTVIVPTMPRLWWGVQWYRYVPGVEKVKLKLACGLRVAFQTPVSEVVVCSALLGLCQVTSVPAETMTVDGTNENPEIEIA
jgi:hypothetical protein